jgi:DNA-binding phage protein
MTTATTEMFNRVFGEVSPEEKELHDVLRKAFRAEAHRIRIGREIKEALDMQGMTQVELAKQISMQPADLSKMLRGKTNITLNALCRISEALGLKVSLIPAE